MAATATSRIPPSYLANTAVMFSTFIVGNNILALVRPKTTLGMLGFPSPVAPTDQKTVEGLLRMFAATRVTLGLSSIAVWWYGDYRALAFGQLAGLIMAGVDGWVSKELIGKGEWGHWGAAPIAIGLGGGLLALCGV